MITISTQVQGKNEWNPPLDTFCIQIKRLLKRRPDLSDQEIANIKYNESLEVAPLSAIAQIREALKANDHPPCGFSEDDNWLNWTTKHKIEGVSKVS